MPHSSLDISSLLSDPEPIIQALRHGGHDVILFHVLAAMQEASERPLVYSY